MKKNANVTANTKNASKVTEINLSKFAEKLSSVNLKEKNVKETVYIYPPEFSTPDINSEKGKKFRNKLRNSLQRFCNNVFVYAKQNNIESLKKEIASFEIFYKENYRLNDFSLLSITNSKDESKIKDISFMLEIIKEVKK